MKLMFSDRYTIEKTFDAYCKERKLANCAGNFLVWLLTTIEGKQVAIDIFHDIMSDMIKEITR